ncbi:hypothetical protein N658DRAFT_522524 [Parathielavia hyrcaniae]|uniref:Uncharacterized protein n=1 Tax=Parathielavia hyrcaniae TaxID=113614 RepID=A0AAN6Q5A9_9PEZI|nr:hypothetical protein N658DRAFT_522524 [Parathielavia hyrcaniae]
MDKRSDDESSQDTPGTSPTSQPTDFVTYHNAPSAQTLAPAVQSPAIDQLCDPPPPICLSSDPETPPSEVHTLRRSSTPGQVNPSRTVAGDQVQAHMPPQGDDSNLLESIESPPWAPKRKQSDRSRAGKTRRHRRRQQRGWEREYHIDSTGHLGVGRDERENRKRIALRTDAGGQWRPQACSWVRTKTEPVEAGPLVKVTDSEGEEWFLEDPTVYVALPCIDVDDDVWTEEKEAGSVDDVGGMMPIELDEESEKLRMFWGV